MLILAPVLQMSSLEGLFLYQWVQAYFSHSVLSYSGYLVWNWGIWSIWSWNLFRVINTGLCVFFFMQPPRLVGTISGRYCHLSRCISGFFIKNKGSIVLWTYVCIFNLILLINMSILMLKLCCFYFYSSLYNKT